GRRRDGALRWGWDGVVARDGSDISVADVRPHLHHSVAGWRLRAVGDGDLACGVGGWRPDRCGAGPAYHRAGGADGGRVASRDGLRLREVVTMSAPVQMLDPPRYNGGVGAPPSTADAVGLR